MLFGLAALECKDAPTRATGSSPVPIYPSDHRPAMQSLLAALAHIETRWDIMRERLEQGAGTDDEKRRLRAELEAALQRGREPIVLRMAQL